MVRSCVGEDIPNIFVKHIYTRTDHIRLDRKSMLSDAIDVENDCTAFVRLCRTFVLK